MNRADRRALQREEKAEKKADFKRAAQQFERDMRKDGDFNSVTALRDPAYMIQVVQNRAKVRQQWEKNGITKDDLSREYDRGYNAAKKEIQRHLAVTYARYFFAGVCITLHRDFKFGEKRLERVLQTLFNIMSSEICDYDIVERCKEETGVEIDIGDMRENAEIDIGEIQE